jgi:ketosteroid isomerase-like protein
MRAKSGRVQILLLMAGLLAACAPGGGELSPEMRREIASEIDARVRDAYDLSKPGSEERMIALYADTGRVVSSSAGRAIASRDTVVEGIKLFWKYVGANMKQPKWIWTHTYVDVLSPKAAVFTGTYRVPHLTPRGDPHEIAGAMTLVFEKRGSKWGVVQEHLSDAPPDTAMKTPMDTTMKMKRGQSGGSE